MHAVKSDVSVIIVNFNGGELLAQCVQSVLQSTVPVQVLVSDNDSHDDSICYLLNAVQDDERLYVHSNDRNLGFAQGTNMVLPMATGKYLLFLNPDCLIQSDTLEEMLKQMETYPKVGMAGCLMLNLDGTEQAGCRRRVPTPARSLIRFLHLGDIFPALKNKGIVLHQAYLPTKPVTIEAISGAFMFVRREAMEEVGLMDEHYFLHCEDLDWCMRFRQKNWKILFVPNVKITHAKGVCSEGRAVRVEWHKHNGMIRFYRKFLRHQYPLPLMWGVVVAVWLRFSIMAIVLTCRRIKVH